MYFECFVNLMYVFKIMLNVFRVFLDCMRSVYGVNVNCMLSGASSKYIGIYV